MYLLTSTTVPTTEHRRFRGEPRASATLITLARQNSFSTFSFTENVVLKTLQKQATAENRWQINKKIRCRRDGRLPKEQSIESNIFGPSMV